MQYQLELVDSGTVVFINFWTDFAYRCNYLSA